MSDARIREIELQIGMLEDDRGNAEWERSEAYDTIAAQDELLTQIEIDIGELNDELAQEPFDEPTI